MCVINISRKHQSINAKLGMCVMNIEGINGGREWINLPSPF